MEYFFLFNCKMWLSAFSVTREATKVSRLGLLDRCFAVWLGLMKLCSLTIAQIEMIDFDSFVF